jgi:peptide/nickel transport system ATP-binding protein
VTPVVRLRDVAKHFVRRQAIGALLGRAPQVVRAVDGVSFALSRGRVLGLAGESGSGKSTLANLLVGLERTTAGTIEFAETHDAKAFRRHVQMVFQDPFGSLNPRFTIARTVEEPLLIHGFGDAEARRARALEALEAAELRPGHAYAERLPHELSGGQRQRVAIARAIVLGPSLLIADEPVSMLDVSVRAGILRLLRRLVRGRGMALLFITHDLSLIGQICDELAVLYRGKLVEHGPALRVLREPLHPYTRQLIAAVPVPDPTAARSELSRKLVSGAGTTYRGDGCRFSPRCDFASETCAQREPDLAELAPTHRVACHHAAQFLGNTT